jgi:hypothetical protein
MIRYIPLLITPSLKTLEECLKHDLEQPVWFTRSTVPDVPHAKVTIKVIKLERDYVHQRLSKKNLQK